MAKAERYALPFARQVGSLILGSDQLEKTDSEQADLIIGLQAAHAVLCEIDSVKRRVGRLKSEVLKMKRAAWLCLFKKRKKEDLLRSSEQLKREITLLERSIGELLNRKEIGMIMELPEKYRNPRASMYMLECVTSERVDSLEAAAALFDGYMSGK